MQETIKKSASFKITISHALYMKLKEEHAFKQKGAPVASYGVIGKLIETIEKRFKSVELNYKGE